MPTQGALQADPDPWLGTARGSLHMQGRGRGGLCLPGEWSRAGLEEGRPGQQLPAPAEDPSLRAVELLPRRPRRMLRDPAPPHNPQRAACFMSAGLTDPDCARFPSLEEAADIGHTGPACVREAGGRNRP